jgi:outer membrane protein assembly factor BamA
VTTRVAVLLLAVAVFGKVPNTAIAQPVDPLEGRVVREIRVTGLRRLSPDVVERQLATRVGEPFRRETIRLDQRRLDELRLFSAVQIEPRLEGDAVVLDLAVKETAPLLPVVVIRVTDENGVSAGPGLRTINLLGHGTQMGVAGRFGGETGVSATVDTTTITPGDWYRHFGFSYSKRRNTLYDFDERATSADMRIAHNWSHGLRAGALADVLSIDTGTSGLSLSADGTDVIPTLGLFFTIDTLDSSTNPRAGTWAEVEVDRLFGDAQSWTFILDGRRFQRLAPRHGLALFSLATFQTGEVGVGLPDYLQFDLGGGNTVRGWGLGSRRGRNQFIGTLEYSFVAQPVRSFTVKGFNFYVGLQIAAFADLGFASDGDGDQTGNSAIDGYGVGLRVLVPFIDLIRIDVAWGEPGQGATAYFGVSLKAARQRQRVR